MATGDGVADAPTFQVGLATKILVHNDIGINWETDVPPGLGPMDPQGLVSNEVAKFADAVFYLREGIQRMMAPNPPPLEVSGYKDKPTVEPASAIVFTLLAGSGITDPQLVKDLVMALTTDALTGTALKEYEAHEAFAIVITADRLLLVANSLDGLACAVPELLESVGYEVLGMGPNWTHVPSLPNGLTFTAPATGVWARRPSFLFRGLWPTTESPGTITADIAETLDKGDEPSQTSYARWLIGGRLRWGFSIPPTPTHSLHLFHKALVSHIAGGAPAEGFLCNIKVESFPFDPPPTPDAKIGDLWVNTNTHGPGATSYYVYTAQKDAPSVWKRYFSTGESEDDGLFLDLSNSFVRSLILADMLTQAKQHFATPPAAEPAPTKPSPTPFVYYVEHEDGSFEYDTIPHQPRHPGWYTEEFPLLEMQKDYKLNGFCRHGFTVDQVAQKWVILDTPPPAVPVLSPAERSRVSSNMLFGLCNWLLAEFDKAIAKAIAQPIAQDPPFPVDAHTWPATTLVSAASYNEHDLPPTFNLDDRIVVNVEGYGKNRGTSGLRMYVDHADVALAFGQLLSHPISAYREISSEAGWTEIESLDNLSSERSNAPGQVSRELAVAYEARIRGISYETDFNFGKYGLLYYLYSKLLWNHALTQSQLGELRECWLLRAFGSAASAMRDYYDFMNPENFPVSSRNTWATATRLLDNAAVLVAGLAVPEPEVQRRIDDLKQYWYYYSLVDRPEAHLDPPAHLDPEGALRDFVWKGQMSYMIAMNAVLKRMKMPGEAPATVAGVKKDPETGLYPPARYTPKDLEDPKVGDWWERVLKGWQRTATPEPVHGELAVVFGPMAKVPEEKIPTVWYDFHAHFWTYDFNRPRLMKVAEADGDEIGFKLFWPVVASGQDLSLQAPVPVRWSVSRLDGDGVTWVPVPDASGNQARVTEPVQTAGTSGDFYLVEGRIAAAKGTYKFDLGWGGNNARLAGLKYNLKTGTADYEPHTYSGIAASQGPSAFFYIPQGTEKLVLDVYSKASRPELWLWSTVLPGPDPVPPDPVPPDPVEPGQPVPPQPKLVRTVKLVSGQVNEVDCNAEGIDSRGTIAKVVMDALIMPYLMSVPRLWALSPFELLVPAAIKEHDFPTL